MRDSSPSRRARAPEKGRRRREAAPPDPAAAAAAADGVHFADEVNAPLETVTRHGESYYERPPGSRRRPPRPAQQQRRAVAFGDAAPLTFIAGVAIGCGLMALVLQRSNK